MNFAKFLKTPFLQHTPERLVLYQNAYVPLGEAQSSLNELSPFQYNVIEI